MLRLNHCHHIAIICSDLEHSKAFYTQVLGFTIVREVYRAERESYKIDLALNGAYLVELFSFPSPPKRVSKPEATGLRHIAFEVDYLADSLVVLDRLGVAYEPVRIDEITGKQFTFIADPDDLPIELYEK